MASNPANPPPSGKAKLVAVVGSAALGLIAVVGGFEGKSNDPYLDIVKVPTVCYGETRVPMKHYTDAECNDMLADGLSSFAQGVLERNPSLKGHDAQLLAATSLAYNIGPGPSDLRVCANPKKRKGYNCSTVAKRFSAGNWKGACDAFLMWSNAGGKPVLRARRQKERTICLRGL